MCCLFAIGAAFAPRLTLLFLWIFTPLINRAFGSFLWPLLGLIFLPFTTLMYVLVYSSFYGVYGLSWIWIALGFLLDVGSYSSGYASRNRTARTTGY
jgi:hypothetical protein